VATIKKKREIIAENKQKKKKKIEKGDFVKTGGTSLI
jgi:hypothetical protein